MKTMLISFLVSLLWICPAVTAAPASDLLVVPDKLDLGAPGLGASADALVWLVNTSDQPITLTGAKGSCGCIGLDVKSPRTIPPRSAIEIAFAVKAPRVAGKSKTVSVTFSAENQLPLKLPVTIASTRQPEPADREADQGPTETPIQASVKRSLDALFCGGVTFRSLGGMGDTGVGGDSVTAAVWAADGTLKGLVTCRLTEGGAVRSALFEPIETLDRSRPAA